MNIAKKTALITGANQGLGFETAKQLAQLGYYVYLGSRNKSKGNSAVEKLNELGFANVEFIEIDVTDISSIKSAKQSVYFIFISYLLNIYLRQNKLKLKKQSLFYIKKRLCLQMMVFNKCTTLLFH